MPSCSLSLSYSNQSLTEAASNQAFPVESAIRRNGEETRACLVVEETREAAAAVLSFLSWDFQDKTRGENYNWRTDERNIDHPVVGQLMDLEEGENWEWKKLMTMIEGRWWWREEREKEWSVFSRPFFV